MKRFLLIILALFFVSGCQVKSSRPLEAPLAKAEEKEVIAHELKAEVPILIYHQIRPATSKDSPSDREFILDPIEFESQMKYLRDNGFTGITINRLADYLSDPATPPLPEKPVAIVFDDGTIGHYQNAFPILKKYSLVGTFYIFTNPIGKSKNYMSWE